MQKKKLINQLGWVKYVEGSKRGRDRTKITPVKIVKKTC